MLNARLLFLPYLREQLGVARRIILIWGNHDFLGEFPELWPTLPDGVTLLHDSGVEIDGVKFYGTPWVPNLPMWALARKHDAEIAPMFAAIPVTTDVLISHGPANGTLDRVIGWREPVGSPSLLANIERVKPKLHVFGHIHEGRGNVGASYNVSAVTESYQPRVDPIVYVEL